MNNDLWQDAVNRENVVTYNEETEHLNKNIKYHNDKL
ncbi:MAG: hypothetical protein RLY58_2116 [Pseudomonadota bacterium]|jgi:hypothetical protein